jgi:hypothetical protein
MEPLVEGQYSLYPFDGIGIYDRERFIQSGGFDITIKNPTWQLMDFGFRAHLWGEEIALNLHFKLLSDGELPAEDYTIDESYNRFALKNLAPKYKGDYAHIPLYRFPSFLLRSQVDFFSTWKEFCEGRNWVKKNKFRWRYDDRAVTKKWDTIGEQNDSDNTSSPS